MRNRIASGMTLVEIMIGSVVLLMVFGGIYSLFSGVSKSTSGVGSHFLTQRISFNILKKLEADIQNATDVAKVSDTELQIDHAGSEKIVWKLENAHRHMKLTRSVNGGSKDHFDSAGILKDAEFILHDDSKITGYSGHGSTDALHSGRLVVDIGLEFITNEKKSTGYFRRIFSSSTIRGVKF